MYAAWRDQQRDYDHPGGGGGSVPMNGYHTHGGGSGARYKRPMSTEPLTDGEFSVGPMSTASKRSRGEWDGGRYERDVHSPENLRLATTPSAMEQERYGEAAHRNHTLDRETQLALHEESLHQAKTLDACRRSLNGLTNLFRGGFKRQEETRLVVSSSHSGNLIAGRTHDRPINGLSPILSSHDMRGTGSRGDVHSGAVQLHDFDHTRHPWCVVGRDQALRESGVGGD